MIYFPPSSIYLSSNPIKLHEDFFFQNHCNSTQVLLMGLCKCFSFIKNFFLLMIFKEFQTFFRECTRVSFIFISLKSIKWNQIKLSQEMIKNIFLYVSFGKSHKFSCVTIKLCNLSYFEMRPKSSYNILKLKTFNSFL